MSNVSQANLASFWITQLWIVLLFPCPHCARCTCAIPHVKSADIFISGAIFHNKIDQNQCCGCWVASYFERRTLISVFALRSTSSLTRRLNRCQKWVCSRSDSELRGKGLSEIKWYENKITVSSVCCCNWMTYSFIFLLSEKSCPIIWPLTHNQHAVFQPKVKSPLSLMNKGLHLCTVFRRCDIRSPFTCICQGHTVALMLWDVLNALQLGSNCKTYPMIKPIQETLQGTAVFILRFWKLSCPISECLD